MILHLALLLQTRTVTAEYAKRPPVKIATQLFRFWNPANGEPVAVVSYLATSMPLSPMSLPNQIELRFAGDERHPHAESDTSLVKRFAFTIRDFRSRGYALIPLDADASSWRMRANWKGAPDTNRWTEKFVPLEHEPLAVSDVMLGLEGEQVLALVAGRARDLVPQPLMNREDVIMLYYQVKSATARKNVETTVRVMRVIGHENQEEEVFQVAFRNDIPAGISQAERPIGVASLTGSRYFVDLTVFDPARGDRVKRREVLDLVK